MKKLLPVLLLLCTFSIKSIAQNPTDHNPPDPGLTYEDAYAAGAAEAANLKISLASNYNGSFNYIEWHALDLDWDYNVGAVVPSSYSGLIMPKIIWTTAPSSLILQNQTALQMISALEDLQFESEYDMGYYQGYYYSWNASYY